jgi:hypothetical protein
LKSWEIVMSNHHEESNNLHFEDMQHPEVRYEDRDLGGRAVVAFLVSLVITVALLCLCVWGYYSYRANTKLNTEGVSGEHRVANVPPAFKPPTERFPKPVLQPDDVGDMQRLNQQNDELLSGQGGNGAIPIERAIEQISQKGLPVRTQPPIPPSADFGSGSPTVAGQGGGTRPETRN